MTDEQARALGERWIKAGGGWLVDGGLARWSDGAFASQRLNGSRPYDEDRPLSEWWPDLRDPATRGAALEVVRERWGRSELAALRYPSSCEEDDGGWFVLGHTLARNSYNLWITNVPCATEAEALVAALEAAP